MNINKIFDQDKRVKILAILFLLFSSIVVSYLIAYKGIFIGVAVLALFIVLPFLLKSIQNYTFGFFLLTFYSFFLFFIGRLLPVELPMGVGVELVLVILLVGILVSSKTIDWSLFRNTISFFIIITTVYGLLQFFNPYVQSLSPWFIYTRALVFNIILYFVVVIVFDSAETIKQFTKFWLALALISSIYGIFQEFFGYSDFEWRSIYNTPGTIELIQNGAVLRKFSFFSDVATFGMFMAFSSIFCTVLAFGPFKTRLRIALLASAIIFLLGMSYSGTRTATAMIPFGLVVYGLLSITRKSTIILGVVVVSGFLIFLNGPFYGATAVRVRSAFKPGDDASMGVREINRSRIQPYLRAHPFGGGIYTTGGEGNKYSPGHTLAGFPTDSGYLKTGLEIGWIGLIIELLLYIIVLRRGVINYYKVKNKTLKILYAAYISSFFALCVANFTQNSTMTQKPNIIIVFAIYAIMPNMIKFDDK